MQKLSEIAGILDSTLTSLESITNDILELADCIHATIVDDMVDEEKKVTLFLENTTPKIVGFTYRIPFETHLRFKQKCVAEGWSIQEGVSRLIQAYIDDRIVLK